MTTFNDIPLLMGKNIIAVKGYSKHGTVYHDVMTLYRVKDKDKNYEYIKKRRRKQRH